MDKLPLMLKKNKQGVFLELMKKKIKLEIAIKKNAKKEKLSY